MRQYIYRVGIVAAFCFSTFGFWLIYSSFIVANKIPIKLRMTLGVALNIIAWIILNVILDVLEFGHIFWGHLL